MENYVYDLLDTALLTGLKEIEFWDMTIAEIGRHIEAYQKIKKMKEREKASYDYILSTLIVKGFSISMGSKEAYPSINEAYYGLFDDVEKANEEKIQQRKDELSVLRFKQFAQSYNERKNKEVLTDK